MLFIDLQQQYQKNKLLINDNIQKVLGHGQFIKGAEVQALEENLSEYTGAKYAIACGSGTDALQLALMALDLQEGDEIITTSFTFIATAEVIALLKLKPIFVDIEEDTYNIDIKKIPSVITSKTKVIIPVSLYGQCANMDEINALAKKHNLIVIEDAAQSFGATYKDKKSCNVSDIATTSFFPSKPLGCYGDGGMVFTYNQEIAKKVRIIANHGQEKRYHHTEIGLNSRLDTIQAAILLAKLENFEWEIERRKEIGNYYTDKLKDFVITPIIRQDRDCIFAQYTIAINNRDLVQNKLKESYNIPTTIHYPIPLHKQPVFQGVLDNHFSCSIAESVSKKVISLPMHPYLVKKDMDYIIESVKKAVDESNKR